MASVAILIRSSLILIVINIINHARVADFESAVVVSPFQTNGKPLSSDQKRLSEIDVGGDNKSNINLTA
jgi:hypothetical protein